MRRDLQDPSLYKIYENLPKLEYLLLFLSLYPYIQPGIYRHFCDVQPFSSVSEHGSTRAVFSSVIKILPEASVKYVILLSVEISLAPDLVPC